MYKQSLKTEQDLRSVLSKQKIEAQGLEIDLREVRKEKSLLEDAVAHLKNQVATAAAAQIEQAALNRSNSLPTHRSWFFSEEPTPAAPNSTANISGLFSEPACREDAAASAVEQAMLPASVDEPASAASDAEIATWFREQQQANDAVRKQIDVDEHKRLKVELPKLHQVSSRQPFMAVLY